VFPARPISHPISASRIQCRVIAPECDTASYLLKRKRREIPDMANFRHGVGVLNVPDASCEWYGVRALFHWLKSSVCASVQREHGSRDQHVSAETRMPFSWFASRIRPSTWSLRYSVLMAALLIDLDGVLYEASQAVRGAADVIGWIEALGTGVPAAAQCAG
jgi:hypothetical protein